MTEVLVNLGFYRFTALGNLVVLRESLRVLAAELELKGTILLAAEGLNVMLSGRPESIERFKDYAKTAFGVDDRSFKENAVDGHSFNRMLIKIKKEIIPVGDPALRPSERTARRISSAELKQWLDEGRDCVLVDTRNQYEVEVGTFQGAETLALENSRQFADRAAEKISAGAWNGRPVVTFCTGGIRCEKASALLLKLGMKDEDVYQLDGGILRYFEEQGGAHFDGNCFVFDWRLAVNGKLEPAERSLDPTQSFGRHSL